MVENSASIKETVHEQFMNICGSIENLKRKEFEKVCDLLNELQEKLSGEEDPNLKGVRGKCIVRTKGSAIKLYVHYC